MILGTCNINNLYNRVKLDENQSFKILDYFYKNGCRIVDSAWNYGGSLRTIGEWIKKTGVKDLKVTTKIWHKREFQFSRDQLDQDIYCCMTRNSRDEELIQYIKGLKSNGQIEKTGISIYYQEELRSDMNVVFIPNNYNDFKDKLDVMILPSDLYIRSLFNLNNKDVVKAKEDFEKFKQYERKDLGHLVYAVVGVSSLDQLKQNMEIFK